MNLGPLLLAFADEPAHAVPVWVTFLFGLILAAMIVALAFEEKLPITYKPLNECHQCIW